MVQPPGKCFWSDAGDGLVGVSLITSGGRTATLADSGFDFQHAVSYWGSVVTVALKCTVGWARGMRQWVGRIAECPDRRQVSVFMVLLCNALSWCMMKVHWARGARRRPSDQANVMNTVSRPWSHAAVTSLGYAAVWRVHFAGRFWRVVISFFCTNNETWLIYV